MLTLTCRQDGEEQNVRGLADDRLLDSLMRSVMHSPQRFGRSPSFVFQPQRFGRENRIPADHGANVQMQSRTQDTIPPQFWKMAIPQRFGKKK
uniref:Uncharacterized protein n=1 Tax=Callorhinchus milii TaxID=7868 RepID=A0A4W3IF28_CALMI